jgi:RNA polymerase sigma-70 factor, ECF subfamily
MIATFSGAGMPDVIGAAHDPSGLREHGFLEEAMPWLDAVYRFALRLSGGDGDEAEDLVQETFLRTRERKARRPETPESQLDIDTEAIAGAALFHELGEADPERDLFRSLVGDEVNAAIAQLPDEFREAVILGDIEGLPYAEIAGILGVPLGTVKSRLFRGRRLLAVQLRDYARDMGFVPGEAP